MMVLDCMVIIYIGLYNDGIGLYGDNIYWVVKWWYWIVW